MRNRTFFSSPSKSTSPFRLKGVTIAVQHPSNLSSFILNSSFCPLTFILSPEGRGVGEGDFSIMGQKNKISRRKDSQTPFFS
jgi:hypothetical protein